MNKDGKKILEDVLAGLPRLEEGKNVCLALSGGLDSTVLLYVLIKKYGIKKVKTISFDFGQTHSIELEMVKRTQAKTSVYNKLLKLDFLADINKDNCSLIDGSNLKHKSHEENEENEENEVISSYVSHRNLIFTSIIASFAENQNCSYVALGLQAGDSYGYWDTTPEFVNNLNSVLKLNDSKPVKLISPFVLLSKSDELRIAHEISSELGHDILENTWTCYNGYKEEYNYKECSECSACNDKLIGYIVAGFENTYILGKFNTTDEKINKIRKGL